MKPLTLNRPLGPLALALLVWGGILLALGSCYAPGHDARTKVAVASMAVGRDLVCAIHSTGDAYCWGKNHYNIISASAGTSTDFPEPQRIFPDRPISQIALGTYVDGTGVAITAVPTMCAVTQGGDVLCQGSNSKGMLGDGSSLSSTADFNPIVGVGERVGGASMVGVTQIVGGAGAGEGGNFCVLQSKDNGVVACWGENTLSRLGTSMAGTNPFPSTPLRVQGIDGVGTLQNAATLVGNGLTNCAVLVDERVACWGGGAAITPTASIPISARGDGNSAAGSLAAYVVDVGERKGGKALQGVKQLGIAPPPLARPTSTHACAVVDDPEKNRQRQVFCWGQATDGVLGNGRTTLAGSTTAPTPVMQLDGTPLNKVLAVLIGRSNCALFQDSIQLVCWGKGSGTGDPTYVGGASIASRATSATWFGLNGQNFPIAYKIGFSGSGTSNTGQVYCLHFFGGIKCLGANFVGMLGQGRVGVLPQERGTPDRTFGNNGETAADLPFIDLNMP